MRVRADWISWDRTLNVDVLSYSNPVLFEMTWIFPCKFLKLSYLDMQKISINGADRFWPREPPYFALFNVVVLVVWHFHLICLTPFQMSPVPSLHNDLKAFLNSYFHKPVFSRDIFQPFYQFIIDFKINTKIRDETFVGL